MAYEINFKALVKTSHGKKLSHKQMVKIIDKALWNCEEFRDVLIIDYQGDTEDSLDPFSDIRQQILND